MERAPVRVGYMRASKADGSQVLDLQRDALATAEVGAAQLYEDRASGRRDDRPGLAACLKSLRSGDMLVIWKLDRLGRALLARQWGRIGTAGHLLARRGKGRTERLWPVSGMTGWRAAHAVMQAAGVDGPQASPKGLRHGFGATAVSAGIPLNLVQKWLGHAQLITMAIYADAVGAEEKDIARRMWRDG